jgi:glycosyltransferase involved in cell wall biosynthesis
MKPASVTPAITVALPFLNAAATLRSAVDSILGQTFADWELLLLDDGSTDGSLDIAKGISDPRVKVLSDGTRKGISARLNQGVREGRGRYFCRMDADDLSFPDRLSRQLSLLEAQPELDLIGASVLVFDDRGIVAGKIAVAETHEQICECPSMGFYLPHPTWMGRRKWFLDHPYDSLADGSEDQQLLYRGYRESRYAGISDVLLGYRENPRSLAKIARRRLVFWRALTATALRSGALHHALLISVIQLLKLCGDVMNLKIGISAARNRLTKIDEATDAAWQEIWLKATSLPVEVVGTGQRRG